VSSDTPALRLLAPTTADLPPDPAEETLAALYRPAAARHLRVNMVATADGGAWGADGRSGTINDATDARVFRVLRSLADVVLVGAGTARDEGYTALERPAGLEHLAASPLELALVTRSGEVPDRVRHGARAPWVVTGRAGGDRARSAVGDDRVLVCPAGADGVDLRAAVDRLAELGLRHILSEGGPHLLGALLAAGAVDELCVTTTPVVVGPGPGRIVAGDAVPGTPDARSDARLGHLLLGPAGTLVARWELRGGPGSQHDAPVP